MLRRCLLAGAALAAVAVPASAILPATAVASNANTALIDGQSVTLADNITNESGEAISLEQYAAERAGFQVTVRSGAEWEAMTPNEFAEYQVLIIGDPRCTTTALSAVESAHIWTPVVMGTSGLNPLVGNRTVVGTDPEFHYLLGGGGAQPKEAGNPSSAGAEHLVQDGIAFAGAVPGATGVYFDTSCFDVGPTSEEEEGRVSRNRGVARRAEELPQPILEGPDGRDKTDILEHLTSLPAPNAWTEDVHPPCGGSVQQVAANPAFDSGETKLLDSDIQGWGCSDHITFPSFPADWVPLAVATDTATRPTCGTDPETGKEVCGESYVLLAGAGIVAEAPNLSVSPKTGSDPAGGTHTVTANVHKEEKGIAGIPVTFSITGQNVGVGGTCTTGAGAPDPECKTDENGNVQFTYADANGVGNDQIIASATLETLEEEREEEVDDSGTARLVKTTERASATQEWTPPPAPASPPPAPAAAVLASKAVVASTGTAHIASSRACVASSGYMASVKGKGIASVTYSLDGHKLGTVKHADSHGAFSLRVHLRAGHSHRLSMRVKFTSAAHTAPLTLHRTLARCAARRVAPRFTG